MKYAFPVANTTGLNDFICSTSNARFLIIYSEEESSLIFKTLSHPNDKTSEIIELCKIDQDTNLFLLENDTASIQKCAENKIALFRTSQSPLNQILNNVKAGYLVQDSCHTFNPYGCN